VFSQTSHTNEDYLKFYTIEKNFIQDNLNDHIPKKFKDLVIVLILVEKIPPLISLE